MNKRAHFTFRLYVAGDGPNSAQAIANLNALCRELLAERHEIEVVDVLRDPQRALADGVLLTPMLLKLSPAPIRKIIGNLNQRNPILQALGVRFINPMTTDLKFEAENSGEEVTALVRKLYETLQQIKELTGGEVDAVAHPSGQYYLLNEAQGKLRLSEERFQGMYAAAATGIAISTLDGHYLQANAAYCRMLGYTEEELKTLDFASLTHPDDLLSNLEIRDDLLAGRRESFVMEKPLPKEGRRHHLGSRQCIRHPCGRGRGLTRLSSWPRTSLR